MFCLVGLHAVGGIEDRVSSTVRDPHHFQTTVLHTFGSSKWSLTVRKTLYLLGFAKP